MEKRSRHPHTRPIVANLGFSEVSFPHPVFHGDTLYAETTVLDVKASSSKPDREIVALIAYLQRLGTDIKVKRDE